MAGRAAFKVGPDHRRSFCLTRQPNRSISETHDEATSEQCFGCRHFEWSLDDGPAKQVCKWEGDKAAECLVIWNRIWSNPYPFE